MLERNTNPTPKQFTLQPKIIIIIIAAIIVVILGLSSFFVVDQTEKSVVLRFGQYNRIVGAGLQWKLPFGIERNLNVPTEVVQNLNFGFRTEQSGITTVYAKSDFPEESVMLTGDLNIVDIEWTIQYRINDPYAWLFNVQDRIKTIRDISQSVINQLAGDTAILAVMGPERTNIEVEAQQRMQTIFNTFGLGIRVVTIKLKNIIPPKGDVQDAFEDVNKSVQDMNRLINEGKQAYNKEIPKAQGEALQLIQIAEGYSAERINEAIGDVARFNAVREAYKTDPDVTTTRLYIETMEDILSSSSAGDVTIIDKKLDNFLPIKSIGTQGIEVTGGGIN
ncbi:MAG: FtsH protease activity modulator HflK [Spirochaetales bacterium]|nr:FtsH protease activity modulator HflK [Spirochaetales bacterium]